MAILDIEKLLEPLSGEAPSGANLEHDPVFREMEEAARPKPPPEFGPEKDNLPEPPDWRKVQKLAMELLGRTRDMRVAVYLCKALLFDKEESFGGFHQGLLLLHGLLEQYWDNLYPQLDPEDDNDPTERVNSLNALSDAESVLNGIRKIPLLNLPLVGVYSLQNITFTDNVVKVPAGPDNKPADLSTVAAGFAGKNPDEFKALTGEVRERLVAVRGCIDETDAIHRYVNEQVGAAEGPRLSDLLKALRNIEFVLQQSDQIFSKQLVLHGLDEPVAETVAAVEEAGVAGPRPAAVPISGEVATRDDVIRLLDKLCDYYRRFEPSSPVPILLKRARRLVSMTFMEILQDLAPTGVAEVEVIRGAADESPPAKQ
jgi:type VI secretion system protein ImpA